VNELIGFECACEFTMDPMRWPIPGSPAWVTVEAVDMPMVKLRSKYGGEPLWVNASLIATIKAVRP